MKVKDVIKKLSQFDPEMDVMFRDQDVSDVFHPAGQSSIMVEEYTVRDIEGNAITKKAVVMGIWNWHFN